LYSPFIRLYHAKDATTATRQISEARYQVFPCNNSNKTENANTYNNSTREVLSDTMTQIEVFQYVIGRKTHWKKQNPILIAEKSQ